jgi:hypothetical protein
MRFACLLVEHLPTRVETLPDPALADRPLVVLRDWDSRVLRLPPESTADILAAVLIYPGLFEQSAFDCRGTGCSEQVSP